MNLRSLLASTVGIAALTQFASPVGAVTLINENFNAATQGVNLTGALTGSVFSVSAGNVDVIGTNSFDIYPGNGNYIDLNGSTSGTIVSSNVTLLGTNTLTFDYGKNVVGSADIFFGGTKIGALTAPSGNTLIPQLPITFNGTQTGALSFVSTNAGVGGIVLDNIKLDSVATSVPEPEAFPGLLLFAGGALMLRKKLAKSRAE